MISIVIPAKDSEATIRDCLLGVLNQEGIDTRYEVIVVDDGSSDRTASFAKHFGIKVLEQENAGPSIARNNGARAAQGDILVFTDSDCVPSKDWLHQLTKPFMNPNIVGVKGAYRTYQKELVPRFVQQEYAFKYKRLSKQTKIDFIDTYSAAYRRDIFLQNNGFDGSFSVPSVEDQEFSFRLARKGYQMVFEPKAIVYHAHDENVRMYVRRKFGIGYWKAFMLRWLPEKTLTDSHTPPTLRWQILFLVFTLISILLMPFFGFYLGWSLFASLLLFYITAVPFFVHIARFDRLILIITPLMLLLRAASLGFGLAFGIVFPPQRRSHEQSGLSPIERVLKRGLDVIGSLIGLIIFSPFFLMSSIAIKLEGPGRVIFTQERIGENGKPFLLYKLRTMVDGAEEHIQEVLGMNPLSGPVYKIPNDPRVTRVGKLIRRWSFDEIPQFWNVLKGDMSLVGPRPEESWVVEYYTDSQRRRLEIKPGMTGPMQVSGRGELDFDERLSLDLEYINHYSIWKDVQIILKTIPRIINGNGAF